MAQKQKGAEEIELLPPTCKQCQHLPMCWVIPSVKCALDNHTQATGAVMFDVFNIARICGHFSFGQATVEETSDDKDLR